MTDEFSSFERAGLTVDARRTIERLVPNKDSDPPDSEAGPVPRGLAARKKPVRPQGPLTRIGAGRWSLARLTGRLRGRSVARTAPEPTPASQNEEFSSLGRISEDLGDPDSEHPAIAAVPPPRGLAARAADARWSGWFRPTVPLVRLALDVEWAVFALSVSMVFGAVESDEQKLERDLLFVVSAFRELPLHAVLQRTLLPTN